MNKENEHNVEVVEWGDVVIEDRERQQMQEREGEYFCPSCKDKIVHWKIWIENSIGFRDMRNIVSKFSGVAFFSCPNCDMPLWRFLIPSEFAQLANDVTWCFKMSKWLREHRTPV